MTGKHIRTEAIGETIEYSRGRKLPPLFVYSVRTYCKTVRPIDATMERPTPFGEYCPECLAEYNRISR